MSAKLVFTTLPNLQKGKEIARALIEKKLAACVNIVPGILSVYFWEGKLHEDPECMLQIKTNTAKLSELEKALQEVHPYDVPEILVIDPSHLNQKYTQWIDSAL